MLGVGIIGIIYIIKGEVKITKNKAVDAKTGRTLGAIMLGAVIIDLFTLMNLGGLFYLTFIALIIAIVVGLRRSQTIKQ